MPSDLLSQYCGRMFEVSFNCALLTFILQQEQARMLTTRDLCTIYQPDLERLRLQPMLSYALALAKNVGPSPHLRSVAEQLLLHFGFKGYLLGLHFLEEYLRALGNVSANQQIHVRYVQCSFRDENSFGRIAPDPKDNEIALRRCLSQLDPELDSAQFNIDIYSRIGRFLKADCLLLLEWGGSGKNSPPNWSKTHAKSPQKRGGFLLTHSPLETLVSKPPNHEKHGLHRRWRIICMDFSVHSLSTGRLRDPNNIGSLRQILLSELSYLRTRGIFSNLGYDVTADGFPEMLFARGLEDYLTAFKKHDKESAKLIQAGGYAYDFFDLLCKKGVIRDEDEVICDAFGISDRDITSAHIRREHLSILRTCQQIYQNSPSNETIGRARSRVVETIQSTARRSFDGGEALFDALNTIDRSGDGCLWLPSLHEIIPVLSPQDSLPVNNVDIQIVQRLGGHTQAASFTVQKTHELLVLQELATRDPYLLLTGNPGIGKTTALVRYLLDCERRGEGFLFFYVSPRTHVNLDLIEKFRSNPKGPLHGSVLAITTNASTLEGRTDPTVLYCSAHLHGTIIGKGVNTKVCFLETGSPEAQTKNIQGYNLAPLLEDQIWEPGARKVGVLYSICQALSANMQKPLSNAVVATLSIQSLKKKEGTNDTLIHLEKIFACARDGIRGRLLPERMDALAKRMPHLIFMIDEITGDESGVHFLEGLHSFASQYGLFSSSSPFHTKIIIADASVVHRKVIERHLESAAYEPEKIYFRHLANPSQEAPVTMETFSFKGLPATSLNTNTYPASTLHLSYHLCIECQRYQEQMTQLPQSALKKTLQSRMLEDLLKLIARPETEVPQILVYIQDKQRLAELIEQVRKRLGQFREEEDYLEIHASISEKKRKVVQDRRTMVRVVFMTASASRGLSFPEATHFLIDVPRFAIEANTMEILQVMYRGRGGIRDLDAKYVQFYLSDRVLYLEEANRAAALQEHILGILDMLLILKTSLMTRIAGSGRIRHQHFQMIPVGGKSVSSAGTTFPDTMADLISNLKSEARQQPDRANLRQAAEYLQQLFGEGGFRWEMAASNAGTPAPKACYLPQRKLLLQRFQDLASQGFDRLLQWSIHERAYPTGGLFVVPCQQKKLDQHYLFDLRERTRSVQGKEVLKLLRRLEGEESLPEHVRLGISKARHLLVLLQQATDEKTQQFVQSSQYFDQYYAIPLLAFLVPEVFEDYFATACDSHNPSPFRAIVGSLVRTWYPANTMLPIGDDYCSYPFVLFRSFNLDEIRRRIFSGNSVFASYELNVLNMILSTQSAD